MQLDGRAVVVPGADALTFTVAGFGPPVLLIYTEGDAPPGQPGQGVPALFETLHVNHMVFALALPAPWTTLLAPLDLAAAAAQPEMGPRQLTDRLHRAAAFARAHFKLGARHAFDVVACGQSCELVARAAVEDPVRWGRLAFVSPSHLLGISSRRRQRLQQVRKALERRLRLADMASASPQIYRAIEQPVWLMNGPRALAARARARGVELPNWQEAPAGGAAGGFGAALVGEDTWLGAPPFVALVNRALQGQAGAAAWGANNSAAAGAAGRDSALESRFDSTFAQPTAQSRVPAFGGHGRPAGAVGKGVSAKPASPANPANPAMVPVWDRFVRVFHWSLVLAFVAAYFSTSGALSWLHEPAGYAALALVVARVGWGFVGGQHARFASFVPGPKKLLAYLGAVLRQKEPRHLGHNPAGAAMIVALLLAVTGIGVSGWMMTTDAFWGNGTVENVHTWLVNVTLVAVAVHVAANLYGSWRHRENLILSMVTGTKPALARRSGHGPARSASAPQTRF